jgi:hypothetical protein
MIENEHLLEDSSVDFSKLPLRISGKVVQVSPGPGTQNPPPFLQHMPRAATYSLVEVHMKALVSSNTLEAFSKELNMRSRIRKEK